MKILAVIITFYPDKKLLLDNIGCILSNVDYLLIWENTPIEECSNYRFIQNEKIEYVGVGCNVGISKALNYAWQFASTKGYEYILTMDQDSVFDCFEHFKSIVLGHIRNQSAIFAPIQGAEVLHIPYREVKHCITSGTLIPIKILNDIGGYIEDFFVDGIDVELCYRARLFGYPTYMVSGCSMKQRYGDSSVKRILFKKRKIYNYSPFRLYGIVRNFKILTIVYPNEKELHNELINTYVKGFLINIVFCESDKWKKILAIVSGYLHGKYQKNAKKIAFIERFLPVYKA